MNYLHFKMLKDYLFLLMLFLKMLQMLVNKVNVKLSDSQLNKLNQTGVNLKMNIKMFEGNNSPDE